MRLARDWGDPVFLSKVKGSSKSLIKLFNLNFAERANPVCKLCTIESRHLMAKSHACFLQTGSVFRKRHGSWSSPSLFR